MADDSTESDEIETIGELAVAIIDSWSDDERVRFFETLTRHFCRSCGRKLDQSSHDFCHCENDE